MLFSDPMAAILEGGVVVFGLVLLLLQVAAREVGFRVGLRRASAEAAEREAVGLIVGAMLGLMSFIMAVSLGFASTRYEERRQSTIVEANAIGTAWLRADAIGDAHSLRIARLLEEYAPLRARFAAQSNEPATLDAVERRSSELQVEIWSELSALVRGRADALTSSLTTALNEAFDAATEQRFRLLAPHLTRIAGLIVALLVIGQLGLGYQLGLRRASLRWLSFLLSGMAALVIVQILDLASPRIGGIRTDTQVYEWAIERFRSPAPPATR